MARLARRTRRHIHGSLPRRWVPELSARHKVRDIEFASLLQTLLLRVGMSTNLSNVHSAVWFKIAEGGRSGTSNTWADVSIFFSIYTEDDHAN